MHVQSGVHIIWWLVEFVWPGIGWLDYIHLVAGLSRLWVILYFVVKSGTRNFGSQCSLLCHFLLQLFNVLNTS